jgi:hypothetical protein
MHGDCQFFDIHCDDYIGQTWFSQLQSWGGDRSVIWKVGGWVKGLMMRITDAFLAFPIIAGVVFFLQLLNLSKAYSGSPGIALSARLPPANPLVVLFEWIDPVLLALILFSWMPFTRLTYAQVLNIRQAEFVQASRALGAGSGADHFSPPDPEFDCPGDRHGCQPGGRHGAVASHVDLHRHPGWIGMGGIAGDRRALDHRSTE